MAHFYGNIRGARGPASRIGTRSSGMHTAARSWTGSLIVDLTDRDGETFAEISIAEGSAGSAGRSLYFGPIHELLHAQGLSPYAWGPMRPPE